VVDDLERWQRGQRYVEAAGERRRLLVLAEHFQEFFRSGGHRHAGMRDEAAKLYLAALWEAMAIHAGEELGRGTFALPGKTAQPRMYGLPDCRHDFTRR
jgi:hypothetical protein